MRTQAVRVQAPRRRVQGYRANEILKFKERQARGDYWPNTVTTENTGSTIQGKHALEITKFDEHHRMRSTRMIRHIRGRTGNSLRADIALAQRAYT